MGESRDRDRVFTRCFGVDEGSEGITSSWLESKFRLVFFRRTVVRDVGFLHSPVIWTSGVSARFAITVARPDLRKETGGESLVGEGIDATESLEIDICDLMLVDETEMTSCSFFC